MTEEKDTVPAHLASEESTETPANRRKRLLYTYAFPVLGLVMLPYSLLIRTGRWSFRMAYAVHAGWEMPSW